MAGNRNPEMPADTWPITKDDKVQMRELGRKLNTFLHDHFKDQERVHIKIVVGAFNYIMDMQTQKGKLIADDFVLADKVIKQNKMSERIEEPYEIEPDVVPPTIEERRAELQRQLAELDQQEDIEEASPAPSASAEPDTTIEAAPAVASTEANPTEAPAADGPSNS